MGKKTKGEKKTGNGKTDPAKGKPNVAGVGEVEDQPAPFHVINPGKCV